MSEILLVDESDDDADLIERSFRAVAVANPIRHFRTAKRASEYLAQAAARLNEPGAKIPSVIVLDLEPGAPEFQILEQIEKTKGFSKMLRVIISQMENTDEIKTAYRAGAHTFITKPVTPQDVQQLITTFPDYWHLV